MTLFIDIKFVKINPGITYLIFKNSHFEIGLLDFNKALALKPDFAPAYAERAYSNYKNQKFDQALFDVNKAIELDPGSGIDYANLGINLRELGFRQEAAHLLKIALDLDPSLDFDLSAVQGAISWPSCPFQVKDQPGVPTSSRSSRRAPPERS